MITNALLLRSSHKVKKELLLLLLLFCIATSEFLQYSFYMEISICL